jgi:hypothetical protein
VRAVKVYVLADYFKIRGLKDYALQRQDERLEEQWTGADLVNCIREVYRTTKGCEDKMKARSVRSSRWLPPSLNPPWLNRLPSVSCSIASVETLHPALDAGRH